MKTVLVTGANGFLGQHLTLFLRSEGYKVIATGRGPCKIRESGEIVYEDIELTDRRAVEKMAQEYSPEVIVHTAALSKPDECENDKDRCLAINVEATKYLLEAATGHFMYISTDFIFGVIVKHNASFLSIYAHNSKLLVKEGQRVSQGQKIAEMGNSDSKQVGLYFELRYDGQAVDPAGSLPPK